MSKDTIVSSSKLTAIGNAIRAKGGTSAQLTLDAMPQAIEDLPSGGGGGFDWSQANGISFYSMGLKDNPDLSGLPTENFTSMYNMFGKCNKVQTLDLSNFDTSNVTDMSWMFYNCENLKSLDLSNFDTSNVTSMNNMFYNCHALSSVNLSNFDTSKLNDVNQMFWSCNSLTSIIWSQKPTVQPFPASPGSTTQYSSQMNFYVPDALVNKYGAATNWSAIASHIRGISELPSDVAELYGIEV